MAANGFLVGQAVVSDASGATGTAGAGNAARGSGGYGLIAASPAVRAREAALLGRSPGASDYLHTHDVRRPFFSFFPLGDERWVLARRFISGTRRGSLHRVVSHALVLSPQALAEIGYEPWLLASALRFRPAGTDESSRTLSQMETEVGDPGLETLADLECAAPEDLRSQALELMAERTAFLRDSWGADELQRRLTAISSAFQAERRVLLGQSVEEELLLALAWSALPAADRLWAPWTTHFTPGVKTVFRIANAVDPPAARALHEPMSEWVILGPGQEGDEEDVTATESAQALAEVVLGGGNRLLEVLRALEAGAVSVVRQPDATLQVVQIHDWGLGMLRRGFAGDVRQLDRFLSTFSGRWLAHPSLAAGVCSVVSSLAAREGDVAGAAVQVTELARKRGAATALAALLFNALASPDGGLDARHVLLAALVGLELEPDGGPAASRPAPLTSALSAAAAVEERLAAEVLPHVAVRLARAKAADPRLLELVAGLPQGLERAVRLLGEAPDLNAATVLLEAALRAGQTAVAADLMLRHVVPALAGRESPAGLGDLLTAGLEALRPEPAGLAEALLTWRGKTLDLALFALDGWLTNAPESALRVAERVAEDGRPLRASARFPELPRRLEANGVPPSSCLPFLLAEATRLDAEKTSASGLLELIRSTPGHAEMARPILAAFERALRIGAAGPCWRHVLKSLGAVVAREPARAHDALARLLGAADTDVVRWGPGLFAAVEALDVRAPAAARALRRSWWAATATRTWPAFPVECVSQLAKLDPDDRAGIVRAWTARAAGLGSLPGERELAAALTELAAPDPEWLTFEAARLGGEVAAGLLSAPAALNRLDLAARGAYGGWAAFRGITEPILRHVAAGDLPAAVELLVSPETLPTVKTAIFHSLVPEALAAGGADAEAWQTRVDRIRAYDPLLQRLCDHLAQRWRRNRRIVGEFLESALSEGCLSAVEHLLHAMRENRKPFLHDWLREAPQASVTRLWAAADSWRLQGLADRREIDAWSGGYR